MDQSLLWALAVLALLTFVKTLLDAFNKTAEAETAHAKHYGKPAPVATPDGKWSQKEKVDFASFILGASVSLGGLIFAAIKAGGEPAGWVMGGLAFIVALFAVAWAANYYQKTNEKAQKIPTSSDEASETSSGERGKS